MRNLMCPYYSDCLDAALSLGLEGFECAGCVHVREVGPIDPAELEGCTLLVWAVLKPEFYQAIQTAERRNRERRKQDRDGK